MADLRSLRNELIREELSRARGSLVEARRAHAKDARAAKRAERARERAERERSRAERKAERERLREEVRLARQRQRELQQSERAARRSRPKRENGSNLLKNDVLVPNQLFVHKRRTDGSIQTLVRSDSQNSADAPPSPPSG